jgi:hypothetical protein
MKSNPIHASSGPNTVGIHGSKLLKTLNGNKGLARRHRTIRSAIEEFDGSVSPISKQYFPSGRQFSPFGWKWFILLAEGPMLDTGKVLVA